MQHLKKRSVRSTGEMPCCKRIGAKQWYIAHRQRGEEQWPTCQSSLNSPPSKERQKLNSAGRIKRSGPTGSGTDRIHSRLFRLALRIENRDCPLTASGQCNKQPYAAARLRQVVQSHIPRHMKPLSHRTAIDSSSFSDARARNGKQKFENDSFARPNQTGQVGKEKDPDKVLIHPRWRDLRLTQNSTLFLSGGSQCKYLVIDISFGNIFFL